MENVIRFQPNLAWKTETKRNKKGAYFLIEIAFFLVFCVIVAAVALGMFDNADSGKVATTTQELDQIRTAIVTYKTYKLDGSLPSTPGDLLGTISTSDSIDGREHGPFLSKNNRWQNGQLLDMWGEDYVIDKDNNLVYSNAGSTDSTKRISVSIWSTD